MNPIPTRPLSRRTPHLLGILSLAGFAALPMNASAALAIGVASTTVLEEVPVSNSDLVNAGSPDLMFYSSTAFGLPANIYDGTVGYLLDGNSIMEESDGEEVLGISTFYLNVTANPLGYEISQIRIFTVDHPENIVILHYPGPYDGHHYTIDYSVVGSTDFETLGTVDISGVGMGLGFSSTWVTINPIPVLTGVDAIRFTWLDPLLTSYHFSIIGEVDIEGTPVTQVPEPSPILLGGMFLGTVCLRRKRSPQKGR